MYLSEKALRTILLVLIGIAVILGIVTTYFYFPSLMNKLGFNKTPSKEVQQLLTDYNMTQTPEVYKAMDEKVVKMAQSAPILDITNCTPNPRIIKTVLGGILKVKNSEKVKHTITIEGLMIDIGPKETRQINLDFLPNSISDIIPYSCDNLSQFSGIIYFTSSN